MIVPAGDELPDLRVEVLHGREYPAADSLPINDPKPHLDKVEPRPGRWGEMNMEPRMPLKPGTDLGSLMGGIVIHHQMQILFRVGPVNLPQEGKELLTTMFGLDRPGHVPGRDI